MVDGIEPFGAIESEDADWAALLEINGALHAQDSTPAALAIVTALIC